MTQTKKFLFEIYLICYKIALNNNDIQLDKCQQAINDKTRIALELTHDPVLLTHDPHCPPAWR